VDVDLAWQTGITLECTNLDNVRQVIRGWRHLSGIDTKGKKLYPAGKESYYSAFGLTLNNGAPWTGMDAFGYAEFVRGNELDESACFDDWWNNYIEESKGISEQSKSYHEAFMASAFARNFFITESRLIRTSPAALLPGDRIVVLFGGHVPYTLFKHKGEGAAVCSLVGDCYLHGFMDGEALENSTTGEADGMRTTAEEMFTLV
jgi:hypothetical protein